MRNAAMLNQWKELGKAAQKPVCNTWAYPQDFKSPMPVVDKASCLCAVKPGFIQVLIRTCFEYIISVGELVIRTFHNTNKDKEMRNLKNTYLLGGCV